MRSPAFLRSLLCLGLALPAHANWLNPTEAEFSRIEDPVQAAFEAGADGKLAEARAALLKLVEEAPYDGDAWATLAVLSKEAGLGREARRAEAQLRQVDPDNAAAILRERREGFRRLKAEILAAKEKRGEIPWDKVTPVPTPDPKVWERLERERLEKNRKEQAAALAPAESFQEGPRLNPKKPLVSKSNKQK
jgi:hypothetical protein